MVLNYAFAIDQHTIPYIIAGIAVIAIIFGVLNHLKEKKRRQAFQTLAQKLGLTYTAKDYSMEGRYGYLHALQQGSNRYAFNVLQGTYESRPVCTFDFHYQTETRDTDGNRQVNHHYFSFFILEQTVPFPDLRIHPENILTKFGHLVGLHDIDFESAEFSRTFVVRSEDKKFAYDICHTRMMEYLLQHKDLSLEIKGTSVAMGFNKRLDPDAVPTRLQQLVEIRNLFPEYLYQQ